MSLRRNYNNSRRNSVRCKKTRRKERRKNNNKKLRFTDLLLNCRTHSAPNKNRIPAWTYFFFFELFLSNHFFFFYQQSDERKTSSNRGSEVSLTGNGIANIKLKNQAFWKSSVRKKKKKKKKKKKGTRLLNAAWNNVAV
ncbi:hypothetical protein PUN28_015425 [Cardiocondyla obscurior]|uniref:Uncharacterized protein n=1 Tax=Cardiocondyla obscurior TaxID=286306 RepID=A0AAW2EVB0_9HYME